VSIFPTLILFHLLGVAYWAVGEPQSQTWGWLEEHGGEEPPAGSREAGGEGEQQRAPSKVQRAWNQARR
jgi:hypothetical protein